MQNQNNKACELFKKEVWLYLEDSLSKSKNEFWNEHISGCVRCSSELEKIKEIESVYLTADVDDIDPEQFQSMINKAVKKRFPSIKEIFLGRYPKSISGAAGEFNLAKAAIGGAFIAAAIVFALILQKPEDTPLSRDKMLDWRGEQVNEQINRMETSLFIIRNKDWKEKLYELYLNGEWGVAYESIRKRINDISNSLERTSF